VIKQYLINLIVDPRDKRFVLTFHVNMIEALRSMGESKGTNYFAYARLPRDMTREMHWLTDSTRGVYHEAKYKGILVFDNVLPYDGCQLR
jgi:hypothetical protein